LECSECPCECSRPLDIITVCGIAGIEWLEGCVWVLELLLVLLTPTYFLFIARKTMPIDLTPRIPEVVEVRSDVLFDLLVVLMWVTKAIPPSSPLEGLCIIMMLVGEVGSARAAIRSWSMKVSNPSGSH